MMKLEKKWTYIQKYLVFIYASKIGFTKKYLYFISTIYIFESNKT